MSESHRAPEAKAEVEVRPDAAYAAQSAESAVEHTPKAQKELSVSEQIALLKAKVEREKQEKQEKIARKEAEAKKSKAIEELNAVETRRKELLEQISRIDDDGVAQQKDLQAMIDDPELEQDDKDGARALLKALDATLDSQLAPLQDELKELDQRYEELKGIVDSGVPKTGESGAQNPDAERVDGEDDKEEAGPEAGGGEAVSVEETKDGEEKTSDAGQSVEQPTEQVGDKGNEKLATPESIETYLEDVQEQLDDRRFKLTKFSKLFDSYIRDLREDKIATLQTINTKFADDIQKAHKQLGAYKKEIVNLRDTNPIKKVASSILSSIGISPSAVDKVKELWNEKAFPVSTGLKEKLETYRTDMSKAADEFNKVYDIAFYELKVAAQEPIRGGINTDMLEAYKNFRRDGLTSPVPTFDEDKIDVSNIDGEEKIRLTRKIQGIKKDSTKLTHDITRQSNKEKREKDALAELFASEVQKQYHHEQSGQEHSPEEYKRFLLKFVELQGIVQSIQMDDYFKK